MFSISIFYFTLKLNKLCSYDLFSVLIISKKNCLITTSYPWNTNSLTWLTNKFCINKHIPYRYTLKWDSYSKHWHSEQQDKLIAHCIHEPLINLEKKAYTGIAHKLSHTHGHMHTIQIAQSVKALRCQASWHGRQRLESRSGRDFSTY